jgi:hypothetical protein
MEQLRLARLEHQVYILQSVLSSLFPDQQEFATIISTNTLTSPDAINTALINQQYKQFGQAKDTPCVASDIRNFLPPFDVPIEVADSILDGTFNLADKVDKPMQAVHHFFEHLQRPSTSDGSKINLTITTEDFKSGFLHPRLKKEFPLPHRADTWGTTRQPSNAHV